MPEPGAGRRSGPGQDLKNILQLDSSLGWGDHYLIPFLYNNRPDYSKEFSEGLCLFLNCPAKCKNFRPRNKLFSLLISKVTYERGPLSQIKTVILWRRSSRERSVRVEQQRVIDGRGDGSSRYTQTISQAFCTSAPECEALGEPVWLIPTDEESSCDIRLF